MNNMLKMKCRCGKNDPECDCIKYIVLDLDATLINTSTRSSDNVMSRLSLFKNKKNIKLRDHVYTLNLTDFVTPGEGIQKTYVGIYRPHMREFIDFCLKYFDEVIIWSAGLDKYVKELCRKIFPVKGKQPIIIYTRDDCVLKKDSSLFKPLDKLYKDKVLGGRATEKNTFVLDDTYQTFTYNEENAIHIPAYDPEVTQKEIKTRDDDCLLKLMQWFMKEEVLKSKDVRELYKEDIFS